MPVKLIRNETPSELKLIGADNKEIVLASLQEKAVSDDAGFDFENLEREGIVGISEEVPSGVGEQLATAVLGGGFWLVVLCNVFARMGPWPGISKDAWPIAVWATGLFILFLTIGIIVIRGTNSLSLVVRWAMQTVALSVILAIGVGLPAATIYFFGGGQELLREAQTSAPARSASLALFGRLIQLAIIATASLLPVLLFFLFDRYQLGTLRKRLYANLFRLDRSLNTIGEINAKYGSQITEAYGSDQHGRGRLSPGSRWPVLVCAFAITIGWIVALAPVGTTFNPQDAEQVLAALIPQRMALVFGFLGVYFFSLRLISLRYARGDLKPKAYTQIMVRIFIVAVLSWVLEAILPESEVTLLLAFLFGITPDEFFTWLKESFRGKVPASVIPQSALPLNELEGIDLYDLGRLESEGIVNVEGLAHHELVDLIIETRIPVPRLIDWVDQAVLYLHLVGGSDHDARSTLRNYGIRTATDMLRAWDKASERGEHEMEAFKKLLGGENPPFRLEVMRDALSDDEWMGTLSCWRDESLRELIVRRALPTEVEVPAKGPTAAEQEAVPAAGPPAEIPAGAAKAAKA